jgi:hypothetical protein
MTYVIPSFGLDQLIVTGPNPFSSSASANGSSIGSSTLKIPEGTAPIFLSLTDDDPFFEDGDSSQRLSAPARVNGVNYAANQSIETEYSYVLRPVGSTDPADIVTIYVLEFGSTIGGITADGWLRQGVTYEFIGSNNDPVVPYSALTLCLRAGTRVLTDTGSIRVEQLRPGMRLQTMDDGFQPLIAVLTQQKPGLGSAAPFRVAPGVLGNAREIWMSPQHRVLMRRKGSEVLVPVKALSDQPGIGRKSLPWIEYVHLVTEKHQILFAEGAAVESLLPGPLARRVVPRSLRNLVSKGTPAARPVLSVGDWARGQ